jgi:hypothetical protein
MKTALKKLVRKLFLTCLNICQDEILSLVARNANAIFGAPDRSALADPLLVPPKMTDQLSHYPPPELRHEFLIFYRGKALVDDLRQSFCFV